MSSRQTLFASSSLREARPDLSVLLRLPRVAWGTVALFGAAVTLWVGGAVGGATGRLPVPVAVALGATSAFAAFTLMHEASHGAVARARWINALVGHVAASILLSRFLGFRQVHRRHHRFTCDPERDPDRWTGGGPAWLLPFRWATADLHYYVEYVPGERLPRCEEAESWASGLLLAAALILLCVAGAAREVLLFWVLPARIALFLSAYSFDFIPHQRPYAGPAREDALGATFVIPGRLWTVLLLCQNHHLVHHLFPGVPFYRCPGIWRRMSGELRSGGAREVPLFALPRPLPGAARWPADARGLAACAGDSVASSHDRIACQRRRGRA